MEEIEIKRKILYTVLILVFLTVLNSAQIDEIRIQQVPMNDYIRQYAIIKFIDNGAVYNDLCTDCTCTLTVYDSKNYEILTDKDCTEFSTGYFGYKATPAEFQIDKNYKAFFTCFSTLRGNGTVPSDVLIVDSDIDTFGIQSDTATSDSIFDGLIPDFDFDFSMKDIITNVLVLIFGESSVSYISWYIVKMLDFLFGEDRDGGLTGIFFKLFKFVVFTVRSPVEGYEYAYALAWSYLTPLLTAFAVPFILYEFYVAIFIASKGDFFYFLKEMYKGQLNILSFFNDIYEFIINKLKFFLYLFIDFIKMLPGT